MSLMNPNLPECYFDNYIEPYDSNGTYKQICRRCGSKGAYIMHTYEENGNKLKSEIVKCEECEEGYRYGKIQ